MDKLDLDNKSSSCTKINIDKIDKNTKIYQKLVSLLCFIFYNSKVNQVLKKNSGIYSDLLILLSILNYLEDLLNITTKKRVFTKVSMWFSNFFHKDLEISVFDGVLSENYIFQKISTLQTFLSNLSSVDLKALKLDLSTHDLEEIADNKFDFQKFVQLENSNDTIVVKAEEMEVLPQAQPLPLDRDIALDKPFIENKPTTQSQEINDPYKPITHPATTKADKKFIFDKLNNDPKFYPFTSKPKLIIHLKQAIACLALFAIAWSVAFLIYFGSNENIILYANKCLNKVWSGIGTNETIFIMVVILFIVWLPVYTRSLFKFLFIPKHETQRFNFPIISSFLAIVWGMIVLFALYKFWYNFLNMLSSSGLSLANNSLIIAFSTVILIVDIALMICLLIGIYKRPRVDVKKIISIINENRQQNLDNSNNNDYWKTNNSSHYFNL
ncbi:hypothetical protein [Mycoplasma sp. SG1]|uniref:hypothetical protein n=1 Tax=Mycoplasma sp. SG1 TaxID=2810348 RepID=UPI0020254B74|nr:hypothetical protein [Mycoplasma sp. SG1]URM53090.1 hypothetical protein JRW51_01950 [Mycoplasma sp. SG1]